MKKSLEKLSPQEARLFEHNFESAWKAVYESNQTYDRLQKAIAMLKKIEAIKSGPGAETAKEATKRAGTLIRKARNTHAQAVNEAMYYSNLDGEGNPLLPENISRRPGQKEEPESEQPRQETAPAHMETPEERHRRGLEQIRSGNRSETEPVDTALAMTPRWLKGRE
ncbi:MAG TPA: hypothetical protein VFK11_05040 [Candidatus Saccharimonadales bacterium]|nr:hypothetical protein [Candidatus Saccharimonadales bacterium]